MKRLLFLLACVLLAAGISQSPKAPLGIVQHPYYADEARGDRERALMDELGITVVRGHFNPSEIAWVKPDGTAVIGDWGKKVVDIHFADWQGLRVVLSLEDSPKITDAQNDAVNAELITYAYGKGVRSYICLNEPEEWAQHINDGAKRASLAARAQRLIRLVHINAPGSKIYGPALHGWHEWGGALTAAQERQKNVDVRDRLWAMEPWVRTVGLACNAYTKGATLYTKLRYLRPAIASEVNHRPGSPFMTRNEIEEVRTLPLDAVIIYCMSGHPGYELMTPTGVRDMKRIAALK